MSQFKFKTVAVYLSLALSIAFGIASDSWTTRTNKYVGSVDKSTTKQHNFIKSDETAQVGWKLFQWKIWNSVGVAVVACAAVTAAVVGGVQAAGVTDSEISISLDEYALLGELD